MKYRGASEIQPTWDPLVRLFHGSLILFFAIAYVMGGGWRSLHSHVGNTLLLLVLFRLIWGVIGAEHARFVDFVTGPRRAIGYLVQLLQGKAVSYRGHNPAGAMMILVLLGSITLTGLSGMALLSMEGSGPLAGTLVAGYVKDWSGARLEQIHCWLANFTLSMIIVHVLGVIVTSVLHRQNLIMAMVTGNKRRQGDQQTEKAP